MISIIFKGILEPKGGPSGYLYNLQESIELNNINDINIISMNESEQQKESFLNKIKSFLKNKIKLPHLLQEKRKLGFYNKLLNDNLVQIKNSQILHFHTTQDLYYFSKIYDLAKHKVLLMSHSPEVPNIEVFNIFTSQGYSQSEAALKQSLQKEADVFAFQNADYLIFPCEGATNPYENFFAENKIDKSKLRYVITASKPLIPKISTDEFKSKYSIPENRKIISYIGRKNKIKGFDIFCAIAERLKNDYRFYFISAGTGDIAAPIQENFLDIGWTDDPASLVNVTDIQIVPNRDTYFDLGIIQALSLNTKVLTTNTGGNSWFVDKNIDMFFADANNLDSFIKLLDDETNYEINKKNINFYNNVLHNNYFAKNYSDLYKEIK